MAELPTGTVTFLFTDVEGWGVTFADEWSRGEQLDLDAAVATALQSLD